MGFSFSNLTILGTLFIQSDCLFYFHSLPVLHGEVSRKSLILLMTTRQEHGLQGALRGFSEEGKICLLTPISHALQRNLRPAFSLTTCLARLRICRGTTSICLLIDITAHWLLLDVSRPWKGTAGVDIKAFDLRPSVNDDLRYVTYLLFDCPHYVILNYGMYAQCEGRHELVNYVSDSDMFPQLFVALLHSVFHVLREDRLSPEGPNVVKVNDHDNTANALTGALSPITLLLT